MATVEELLKDAMALPPEERQLLAQELFDSLRTAEERAIQQEWIELAERRVDEIDAGTATTVPADEAIARAREALDSARRAASRR